MGTSANSSIKNTNNNIVIPTPIVTLGKSKILQHKRTDDIKSIDDIYANDNIKVGISFPSGNYSEFFKNNPMIFMYLLGNRGRRPQYKNGDNQSKGYYHPDNFGGALNRISTYYGGGKSPLQELQTEWDVAPRLYAYNGIYYFSDQIIEIQQKQFYIRHTGSLLTLPQSKDDWDATSFLKKLNYQGLTTGISNKVTSWNQPIFFKFACIDPKNSKNVLFSEASQKIKIYPKLGHFEPNLNYFYYDWAVDYGY